jgi:hypothetical protein
MEYAILEELETDSSVGKNLRPRDGDANFFESKHVYFEFYFTILPRA